MGKSEQSQRCLGREFQRVGVATQKALSPDWFRSVAYWDILMVNTDNMILGCPVKLRTKMLFLSSISHLPIFLLLVQVLAKSVFQTLSQFFPGIPRRPQARWDVQSNPPSILDLLPFGCAWKASKGRCPAWSDAHATADAYNILSFLPISVPIFPSHCGKDPRPCDLSQTGQVSNNKNIKRKKKCSLRNLSLSLLTE